MSVRVQQDSKWLNFHHLYYFFIIAKEGGIAKAADKLHLGQPALSMQLKQLEESLGQKLFHRQKRQLILTEAGRIALRYAEEVFKLGQEMVEAMNDRLIPTRVHVQIGALDSVPKTVTESLILHAYKLGNCSVSILEGKSDELLRELAAHRLDMVITNQNPSGSQDNRLNYRLLARLKVLICGSAKHKKLQKDFPHSLRGQPFVLPTIHSKLRYDVEHFFKINNIVPDIIAETQDTSIQRLLGLASVGLIPISEIASQDLIKSKKMVVIGTLRGVHEDLWMITADRKIKNPIATQLLSTFSI